LERVLLGRDDIEALPELVNLHVQVLLLVAVIARQLRFVRVTLRL
jgi:hypothetical protein